MSGMNGLDLDMLYKYASTCKFIIETGAGGNSTKYLSKAVKRSGGRLISIELMPDRCKPVKRVEYMIGWSVDYDDIIKSDDKDFIDVRKWEKFKKYEEGGDYKDGLIAHGDGSVMKGEKDLIRKSLLKYKDEELDFFFSDSGEYCGIAEWNIVKDKIRAGGYFAAHDIYYPKSIKNFKVKKIIKKSNDWKILVTTKTVQGLLIAQKVK
jgi:hypothetical protein